MTKQEYKDVVDLQNIVSARRHIMELHTDNPNTMAYRSAFLTLCDNLEQELGIEINMAVEDTENIYFLKV